jgi:hypothetical protein
MEPIMKLTRNGLAVATAVGVAAAGGSAFTASNTFENTVAAGQGSTVTAGYAVSAVKYVLDDFAESNELNSVNFTLTPTDASAELPTQVRIRLRTGSYTNCTAGAAAIAPATNWLCAQAEDFLVSSVTTLDIVAVSQPAS